jgi:hypothetical protein
METILKMNEEDAVTIYHPNLREIVLEVMENIDRIIKNKESQFLNGDWMTEEVFSGLEEVGIFLEYDDDDDES